MHNKTNYFICRQRLHKDSSTKGGLVCYKPMPLYCAQHLIGGAFAFVRSRHVNFWELDNMEKVISVFGVPLRRQQQKLTSRHVDDV